MTELNPRSQRILRDMVADQHALKRQIERLNRGQDAGRTTIHHGALQVADQDGKVTHKLGQKGLDPVDGPVPARPATPSVTPGQANATVIVATDGDDEHGESAPEDWAKTRIYATTQPPLEANPAHAKGSITDVDGEATIGVHAGVWHVGVVWGTESGQVSELSEVVTVEVEAPVDVEEMEAALASAEEQLEAAIADFEAGNNERIAEIENLNDVIIPGITQTLQDKADSSELGTLDQTLREAFGEADKAIQQAADDARAKAEAAGATATEADEAAVQAVAEAEAAFARAEAAEAAASTAEASADASAKDAADALTQAQAAGGDATAAQTAADAAQAAADAARTHADTAGTAAAEADAKAAQAAADAAAAQAEAVAAAESSGTSASEAQAAKDRADAAAADAQAAYTRAQEAEESASSASGAASAAETAADTAASNAAEALTQAQNAGGDATAAQAAADLAQQHADTAQAQAGEANTAAANADADAAQAAADAAQAAADAVAAAQSSDTSATEAQAAKDRADAAAADASAAYTRAQEAEDAAAASAGSATAAETAADTAASNAADALAQAQASSGDASAAQAAADAAQGYADTAQAQASEANSKAATADANAAQAAADAAQAVADAAKAAQDAAAAKAEAESAKEYADDQDAEMLAAAATDAQTKADAAAEAVETALTTVIADKGTVYTSPDEPAPDPNGVWLRDGVPHVYVDHGEDAHDWVNRAADLANWDLFSGAVYRDGMIIMEDEEKRAGARSPLIPTDEATTLYSSVLYKTFGHGTSADQPRILFSYNYFDEEGNSFPGWPGRSSAGAHAHPEGQWEWTRSGGRFSFIPPEGPKPAFVAIRIGLSTSWTGTQAYIAGANFRFDTDPTPSVDFDGETPGFAWQGEPFNSAPEYVGPGWFPYGDPAVREARALSSAAQAEAEEAHTAAGAAHAQADAAMTRAAEAESTAIAEAKRLAKDAKDRAEEAIAKGKVIDTRNDNEDPQWYRSNYSRDSVTEFKYQHVMGITGYSGSYAYVTTVVAWSNSSGGPVVQTATIGDTVITRETVGRGDDEVWGEWVDPVAEAKDLAENLPKVLHGTGAPSGTAPNGSIWWQHQGSLQGAVTAQWNRVDGQWASTPIDSEAIANLDVGKLTAGGAVISDAVIQDLTASNGAFDRLDAREGWVGGVALEDNAVTARTLNAEEVFANDVVANTVWSEVVRTGLLTAEEALIGGALIKDDAITTPKLDVTEEMVARLASFIEVWADKFWANEAFIDRMAASQAYFGSEDADQRTHIDGTGVLISRKDENDEAVPRIQLGGGDLALNFYDQQTGDPVGSLSADGRASGQQANYQSYQIAGRELIGDAEQYPGQHPIIDGLPRRAIGFGRADMSNVTTEHNTYGFLEVSAQVEAGRVYTIETNQIRINGAKYLEGRFHYTIGTNPAAPTVRSPRLALWILGSSVSSQLRVPGNHTFVAEQTGVMRILLAVSTTSGGSSGLDFPGNMEVTLTLFDEGRRKDWTSLRRYSGYGGSIPEDLDQQAMPRDFLTAWGGTWVQAYDRDGSRYTGPVRSILQGSYGNGAGAYHTHTGGYQSTLGLGGASSEAGRTMPQALAGASIIDGTLAITGIANPTASQGVARVYLNTLTAAPTTSPGKPSESLFVAEVSVSAGAETRIDLPQWVLGRIKAGTFGGFTYHYGNTTRPYITIARGALVRLRYQR